MANTWTATTNVGWIHFGDCSQQGEYVGEGETGLTICIDESENPYDVDTGKITIATDNGSTTKTVKRCVPTIVDGSTKYYLTFKIDDKDPSDITSLDPCFYDETISSTGNLNITDIKYRETVELSDGTEYPVVDTISLSVSDVDIHYFCSPDVDSVNRYPVNKGDTRQLSVWISLKSNPRAKSASYSITQKGYYVDPDHTQASSINEEVIIVSTSGYSDSDTSCYFDLDFTQPTSCKGGENNKVTFGVKTDYAQRLGVYICYGGFTAKTKCDESVVRWGDEDCVHTISGAEFIEYAESMIQYNAEPSNYGYFRGNQLIYYDNTDRNTSHIINVTAILNDPEKGIYETRRATVEIPTGDTCITKLYAHISTSETSIPYAGVDGQNAVVISYYLSESEQDNEQAAITDEDLLNTLNLALPTGAWKTNNTTTSIVNGVKKTKVSFPQCPSTDYYVGTTWAISAVSSVAESRESACNSAVTLNGATCCIYQLAKFETILPKFDYLLFRYIWDLTDGIDLDSYTVINNVPGLMDSTDTQVSTRQLGYSGNAPSDNPFPNDTKKVRKYIKASNGDYFGLHTGDNTESGAEGAIIFMKNIVNAVKDGHLEPEDGRNVFVDIYANWYRLDHSSSGNLEKNQNMRIEYDLVTGSGVFDTATTATTTDIFSEITSGNYMKYSINTQQAGAVKTTTTSQIHVQAFGNDVIGTAKANISCMDDVLTHVYRVKYDIVTDNVSEFFFPDAQGLMTGISKYMCYNNTDNLVHINKSIVLYYTQIGDEFAFNNFYCKVPYKNTTYYAFPLATDEEYLYFKAYSDGSTKTIRKADLASGPYEFMLNDKSDGSGVDWAKVNVSWSSEDSRKVNIKVKIIAMPTTNANEVLIESYNYIKEIIDCNHILYPFKFIDIKKQNTI